MQDFYKFIDNVREEKGLAKEDITNMGLVGRNWLHPFRHKSGQDIRLSVAEKLCTGLEVRFSIGIRSNERRSSDPITPMCFGNFFKMLMRNRSRTYREVCQTTGISVNTLCKIATCQRGVYLSTADKICNAFLVTYTFGGGYNV